jgi:hypothetical protein
LNNIPVRIIVATQFESSIEILRKSQEASKRIFGDCSVVFRRVPSFFRRASIVFRRSPSCFLCSIVFCRVPSCSVVFRRGPSCSVSFRRVPSCSVVLRLVPSCAFVFRRVSVVLLSCSAVLRRVPSCSVVFRRVPSCSVVFRCIKIELKIDKIEPKSSSNRVQEHPGRPQGRREPFKSAKECPRRRPGSPRELPGTPRDPPGAPRDPPRAPPGSKKSVRETPREALSDQNRSKIASGRTEIVFSTNFCAIAVWIFFSFNFRRI